MYNTEDIKQQLTIQQIFDFLNQQGANPRFYKSDIIVATTICHAGNSQKLYYYDNSKMFFCYTECGSFDIFTLVMKLFDCEFSAALSYVAKNFNVVMNKNQKTQYLLDVFKKYEAIKDRKNHIMKNSFSTINLKEYDVAILENFIYPIIKPWEDEGITRQVINHNLIGYYSGGGQITIPHFDINDRLVGIRGRYLNREDADKFGKYRPLFINKILYNHPLAYNLYNINNVKDNINKYKAAIIFEGEKSCLKYQSLFGIDNDISVACCGSSISDYQFELLRQCGAQEVIIAFDRQFQEKNDAEFKKLTRKLTQLHDKYCSQFKISFIFDKELITDYKDSPIDCGKDIFLQLFQERITW